MPRKTIEVQKLVDYANMQLKDSVTAQGHREGICTMIEQVLMETGNYGGFRFLTSDEVPYKHRPGVHYEAGQPLPYPDRFFNTDETRRQYFLK